MSHSLQFNSIFDYPELVSPSIFELAKKLKNPEIQVAQIDPVYMGGKELCEYYGVDPTEGANCIVIEASHGSVPEHVAIVIPVGYRADLNGFVRRYLKARKVSLANLDRVLAETGMEYGSITPFGLPEGWRILVDARLMEKERIIVGGGKQISKLLLPTKVFLQFGTEVVEGLGSSSEGNVYIGKGNMAGQGVYANKNFEIGDVVIKYNLKPLSQSDLQNLPEGEKMFTHVHNGTTYLYSEPERYVNHSNTPNTYQDIENGCDVALEKIEKGVMITTDATKDDV